MTGIKLANMQSTANEVGEDLNKYRDEYHLARLGRRPVLKVRSAQRLRRPRQLRRQTTKTKMLPAELWVYVGLGLQLYDLGNMGGHCCVRVPPGLVRFRC
jgi:hypothetical protein